MNSTEGSRAPDSGLYPSTNWTRYPIAIPALPQPGRLRRDWPVVVALAAVAFAVTLHIVSANTHAVPGVKETEAIKAMIAAVPYLAAAAAALAVFRPWPAFLAILILTPVWDTAQVSWYAFDTQILLQTVFAVALAVGWLVSGRRRRTQAPAAADAGAVARTGRVGRIAGLVTAPRLGALALAAFVALALASTYFSGNAAQSRTVLLHGLLEPIAMGLILVALRPNRVDLVLVAIALGVSAAVGCMINIVQFVPGASLAAIQANRFHFSPLTYNNVGLLGEVLSMAVPLLLGVLLARRSLRLSATTVALLILSLGITLAGLFLTFSKSAWLATSIASVMLLLLAARGWKSRAAIVLSAGLLSTVVVPWPALVLQVSPPLNDAYRSVMVRIVGESRFDSWNPATVAGQGSVAFRVRAAQAGLNMAEDHPWLGVGLNQYHYYYVHGYAIRPINTHIDHAHSMWPELAAELGFPAMTMVAVIYLAALAALWRVFRNPPDTGTRLLAAAFAAAIVGWIVVATAFGSDIYRPLRNMSSELIMMGVVTAAAFALVRYARVARLKLELPAR